MAAGAVINALWDLRAKRAGKPLWALLASLSPEEIIDLVDFRYLTDALTPEDALSILRDAEPGRAERIQQLLAKAIPPTATTPGWLGYDDEKLGPAVGRGGRGGFGLIKLKVGRDLDEDIRRMSIARAVVGPDVRIAIDANQRWEVPRRSSGCASSRRSTPTGSRSRPARTTSSAMQRSALELLRSWSRPGEHVANRIIFKQMLTAGSLDIVQIDADPRRRGQREHRHLVACSEVRRARMPACWRRRALRARPATVDVRPGRRQRELRGSGDRVHRPSARALPRPGVIEHGRYRRRRQGPVSALQMVAEHARPTTRIPTVASGRRRRVIVTATAAAARYSGSGRDRGGRARRLAARRMARFASRSPTPGSAAPTCTSCTARWTNASRMPAVIGHEMSGRVAEVGARGGGWAIGDPVTVMPLRWCGECPACLAGHQHICQRLIFVGIDSPGSMQQSWTVPAGILVGLPADLSLRDAALVEPTAVAVHDVRRAGSVDGERVLVVGGGPVGLLVAVVAREAGADVLLLEVDAQRRSIASDLGLDGPRPGVGRRRRSTSTPGREARGSASSFEVSGAQAGLDAAVEHARGPRPAGPGRDPRPTEARQPAADLLARADDHRGQGVRANRLRASGRAGQRRRDPRRRAHHSGGAPSAGSRGIRAPRGRCWGDEGARRLPRPEPRE